MKAEKYCVKIKLCRDHTSEKSDLYEFKISLFDNYGLEEFLLLVQNLKIMIEALEILADSAKLQYIYTILRGEALHQFDTFCAQAGSTNKTYLNRIIPGLGMHIFPVNELSKQKSAMKHGTRNPCELKAISYAVYLIDLNDYLDNIQGEKASDKIGDTEINKIILNILQSVWSKQEYMQGFYCETITKKYVNRFERMEFADKCFEGVVEHGYK